MEFTSLCFTLRLWLLCKVESLHGDTTTRVRILKVLDDRLAVQNLCCLLLAKTNERPVNLVDWRIHINENCRYILSEGIELSLITGS